MTIEDLLKARKQNYKEINAFKLEEDVYGSFSTNLLLWDRLFRRRHFITQEILKLKKNKGV